MKAVKTLTGSRAFGVNGQHSDTDWVSKDCPMPLLGWNRQPYDIDDGYLVFRRANENWIVCVSEEAYANWMAAHCHCMVERPRSKDRRKVIFDHYMYGTPLELQKPIPKENRHYFRKRHHKRWLANQWRIVTGKTSRSRRKL